MITKNAKVFIAIKIAHFKIDKKIHYNFIKKTKNKPLFYLINAIKSKYDDFCACSQDL